VSAEAPDTIRPSERRGVLMVLPGDVPTAEPRWDARRITAAEVLQLSRWEEVPGINPDDPRVQGIRRCTLDNIARLALAEALRTGYLYVNRRNYHVDDDQHLATLWGWWCAAAGHPQIVIERGEARDAVRIRCDVSSTGKTWDFAAFAQVARLISPLHASDPGGWLFTDDVLEVDGLDMEDAISVARELVDLASAGHFIRESFDPNAIPRKPVAQAPHRQPIERGDRRG